MPYFRKIPEGRYKLRIEWNGGEYNIRNGTIVWFQESEEQNPYMCFHEGKVYVIEQVFLEPAFTEFYEPLPQP